MGRKDKDSGSCHKEITIWKTSAIGPTEVYTLMKNPSGRDVQDDRKLKALPGSVFSDEGHLLVNMLCPCEVCEYNQNVANVSGGWCYMSKAKPKRCAQFKKDGVFRWQGMIL